ncbi:MAG TPA: hypothetical protein VIK01_27500 [Polyangiaceae bacterium]
MVDHLERRARVGLCATCSHARVIQTTKGSEFWLCEKSKTDPRFTKYPPLPIRACLGFARSEPAPR